MRKRILCVSTVIILLLSTFLFTLQIEADQSAAPLNVTVVKMESTISKQ